MLDKKFIKEKINLILKDLRLLELYRNYTFDDIAKDKYKYAALENFLMKIIGRGIDINQHIISEKAILTEKSPLKYSETFLYLGDLQILPINFSKVIADSAGFRNAIVHEYDEIDHETVYKTVGEAIDQYTKYCDFVMKFLEKNKD